LQMLHPHSENCWRTTASLDGEGRGRHCAA
jgi:hypothetical protein